MIDAMQVVTPEFTATFLNALSAFATLGLLIAAVAQTIAARHQARAANKQAAAADRQFQMSIYQLYQAIASADNATMPLIEIKSLGGSTTSLRLQLSNAGLGPALRVQVGELDGASQRMKAGGPERNVDTLGVGAETVVRVSMQDLTVTGAVVYAESVHQTATERTLSYDPSSNLLYVGLPRIFRPYADLCDIGGLAQMKQSSQPTAG